MNETCDPGKGFAAPVFDAQAVFRHVQDALARPGRKYCLSRPGLVAPEGLSPGVAAFLLALADHETPVWLKGGKNHPASTWLSFHTGAPVVDVPQAAHFAVIARGDETPALSAFAAGDALYPDRSATLLFMCRDLSDGPGVWLEGPGIKDGIRVAPAGLRAGFWDEVRTNAKRFPLGVDMFLVAGADVIGLPRTSQVVSVTGDV